MLSYTAIRNIARVIAFYPLKSVLRSVHIFQQLVYLMMQSSLLKLVFGNIFTTITLIGVLLFPNVFTYQFQNSAPENKQGICPGYRLYYNQTGKCYPSGRQGPCGNLMELTFIPGNYEIGECQCITIGDPQGGWARPTVYWPDTQQCYLLFDQGPCEEGQWIVMRRGSPTCEKIPCPSLYRNQAESLTEWERILKLKFIFSCGGKCYSTLTQATCCEGKLAVFTSDSFDPKCQSEDERIRFGGGGGGSADNSCGDNKEPDEFGGCEKNSNI
ncbi:unnamed protein product [Allacma fusca]|uniref:DUF4789 domain-containing protein n=1 Tax=Allacma fusca TaxID=39272 RepID=A0A8J2PJT9_9HEXA|nr:unnamed protein product [Allacma fusca]